MSAAPLTARPAIQERNRVSPTAPTSHSLSSMIWMYLDSLPNLTEELHQAELDILAGNGTPYEELRDNSEDLAAHVDPILGRPEGDSVSNSVRSAGGLSVARLDRVLGGTG